MGLPTGPRGGCAGSTDRRYRSPGVDPRELSEQLVEYSGILDEARTSARHPAVGPYLTDLRMRIGSQRSSHPQLNLPDTLGVRVS
ncbi:hypothetical protein HJ581_0005470 [Rhodococcus opacus]|nr:hypothetical protein HJ581_0005470 [Rhodococcus opacus]